MGRATQHSRTCRPSRSPARRSRSPPTSTRSASPCSRRPPAACRSSARLRGAASRRARAQRDRHRPRPRPGWDPILADLLVKRPNERTSTLGIGSRPSTSVASPPARTRPEPVRPARAQPRPRHPRRRVRGARRRIAARGLSSASTRPCGSAFLERFDCPSVIPNSHTLTVIFHQPLGHPRALHVGQMPASRTYPMLGSVSLFT
jgi:hypothetical protein